MSNQMSTNRLVLDNPSAVADHACKLILSAAQQAIAERGIFRIVLAGGTTPKQIYSQLAKEAIDWQHWEFYLGDERCLPSDNAERNSRMIEQVWLDKIKVPSRNIYWIKAELGPEQGATEYAEQIKNKLPFDMVLLGMGEDGHTASLFPTHQHDSNELVHSVYHAPKAPAERISLSAKTLSNTEALMIIVTGASKCDSVIAWENGKDLPVAKVNARQTRTILLDKAATCL